MSETGSVYRQMGWLTIAVGLGLTAWGFAFDPSVEVDGVPRSLGYGYSLPALPERVVNTGKAVEKMMIFGGGGLLTVSGLIMLVGGQIMGLISVRPVTPEAEASVVSAPIPATPTPSETVQAAAPQPPTEDLTLWDQFGPAAWLGGAVVLLIVILALSQQF